MKNFFEEIAEHVVNKAYLQNAIGSTYEGKEVKRGIIQGLLYCLLQVV